MPNRFFPIMGFMFNVKGLFLSLSSTRIEPLRLTLLALITLLIFKPMLYSVDIGAVDAYVYHGIIADALEQYRHHIFPIYVGQSLFSFTGTPMGRAPYLLLLTGLLNILTLGKLNSLQIQHATIIFSALGGTYMMYFTLLKIAPKHRWLAFAFAIFFITCPAILALIAKLDMYYSFITIPFLPVFMYALVRHYQKNDALSYILISSSLSLIWMAHPSIAFFCTAVCAIFLGLHLLFKPKILLGIVYTGVFFIILSLWQFTTIFSLKMGEYVDMSNFNADKYADDLISFYTSYFTDTLLPVNMQNSAPAYSQLGYSLWLALIIGVMVAISKRDKLLKFFLPCAFFLIALISPVPYLSQYLWAHFPQAAVGLSSCWPMLRIYPILAALSCFIGVIALQDTYSKQTTKKNKLPNWLPTTLFILTVSWSCYQAAPFTKYLAWYIPLKPAWLLPENTRHRLEYTSGYHHKPMLEGIYEPALHNRLLNADGKELEHYNNKKIMEEICLSNPYSTPNTIVSDLKTSFPAQFNIQKGDVLTPLMKLKILPNVKYMLCFDMLIANASGVFSVDGYNHETISVFQGDTPAAQTLLIPVFTTENMEKDLTITLIQSSLKDHLKSSDSFIKLNSFNVKQYDITQLPIQLHSLIPYRVTVQNPINFSYLETSREYVDGYVALVNGKEYQTRISPSGRVMVPLLPGKNEVELSYKGTFLIRAAFYISLFSWIIVAVYLSHSIAITQRTRIVLSYLFRFCHRTKIHILNKNHDN